MAFVTSKVCAAVSKNRGGVQKSRTPQAKKMADLQGPPDREPPVRKATPEVWCVTADSCPAVTIFMDDGASGATARGDGSPYRPTSTVCPQMRSGEEAAAERESLKILAA